MRIYFDSTALPKKAAKRIQKHFSPADSLFRPPMPLSQAQQITALLLGYQGWHELNEVTKSGGDSPSALDEHIDASEQELRISYQMGQLEKILPFTEPVIRKLVLKFRVSAGNPKSLKLKEDGYRQGKLYHWKPFDSSTPEWRFISSERSDMVREDLYDLLGRWESGSINLGEYKNSIDTLLKSQPENLAAYLYIIGACHDLGLWEIGASYLSGLESAILAVIPSNYPMNKKVDKVQWGDMDNRDYLRSVYILALGYYASGQYQKAKKWFLFLVRCSSIEMDKEKLYLADLRRSEPDGMLHLNM
jgi:hypothetical protein